tara:strand:+ start:8757 stop:11066 length:2310 start_codon:yes stop_codon:yes gene_type:complete
VINSHGQIKGKVVDVFGNGLPSSLIKLNDSVTTITDTNGFFQFSNVPIGTHQLEASYLGYHTYEGEIILNSTANTEVVSITLKENSVAIKGVTIISNSNEEVKREKGYAVDIITTKEVQNLTSDLNQVIKSTPGINIRESGGLGSGFKLSLNGLSGNQVRYFIDGVPMENFGSSLSLNNFPVNQIERIEVYKGVVPISLGADALGGAINIISGLRNKSFVDVSYSFGSFNTHRVSVTAQHLNKKKTAFIKVMSFLNHSDNNYLMRGVPVYDLKLGNKIENIDIRRFNDSYTSTMVAIEGGILNKKLADEWSFKITQANNKNYFQHPNNNILRPFGNFHNRNNATFFSTAYSKSFRKFTAKAFISAGLITSQVIDTSTFKYNWAGDYIRRDQDDPKGELFARRSLFELNDQVLRNQVQLQYKVNRNNSIDLSWSQNYLKRDGHDKVDPLNRSFSIPNSIGKNILGLSYTYTNTSENLEFIGFIKQYLYTGSITTFDTDNKANTTQPVISDKGFGGVVSYKPSKNITFKGSYEKAYRYPEGYEILGDGIYVNPNPNLAPEVSNNYNLGARLHHQCKKFEVNEEVKIFYRNSGNFIRFNPIGPFGAYENVTNVNTAGIEADISISYNNRISFKANGTFQNITDQTKEDEGFVNTNYLSRLPNIPYLFGNVRFGINLIKSSNKKKLTSYWSTYFVKDYFLTWENSGNLQDKNIIPSQLVHSLDIEYSMKNGKYNASLSVSNLTNELIYDNFNIQNPGRAIYTKLRYFISKTNN